MIITTNTLGKIGRALQEPRLLKAFFIKGVYVNHYDNCLMVHKLLKGNLKTFIDVGASDGRFTKAVNSLFPNTNSIDFEPCEEFYFSILNELPNTKAYNLALWNENGIGKFYSSDNNFEGSFFEHGELQPKRELKVKEIQRKRFDSLKIKIERPCFVKLDVEGAEKEVIEGFGNQLDNVDVLQMEYCFNGMFSREMDLFEMIEILNRHGFDSFIQQSLHFIECRPSSCNLIFFKDKK